ncbi:Uncharacterized conserved protein (DUF2036) [Seminavis robusta]|uniref:Uncharacterized conserved protein (DUF2036) n=1 Tax=Seminavis robusta TaxID=568900 RepID=A0A9N8DH10_9STRA|nr:Uncharacterized conserved protein (DUF2036) [Seminavis robusta]|eukprot:Sro141_g065730.1 Uncharacterized conserved protein (DUF2036) (475) ;mRNA; r:18463-20031
MDLINSITKQDNKAALLTLPRVDLAVTTETQKMKVTKKGGRFVLMQLPKGIDLSDLANGSRFVAPSCDDEKRVALVVESKTKSFLVNRLETSNVLVLVAPQQQQQQSTSSTDASKENDTTNTTTCTTTSAEEPALKKAKMSNSSKKLALVPVATRLLTPGVASGSSFLELRDMTITAKQLTPLLEHDVFDPYYTSRTSNPYYKQSKGRTLESLALELQCSTGQVREVLAQLHGFPFPNHNTNIDEYQYGHLSEEALQDALAAIVATLAEEEQFCLNDTTSISVEEFVTCVAERIPEEESYPELNHVLHYAMNRLVIHNNKQKKQSSLLVTDTHVSFDPKQIAICVAHRLFQSQTKPWKQDTLLLKWQSQVPGVGSQYNVDLGMLRGVAVCTVEEDDTTNTPLWTYLPAQQLSRDPEKRFAALFQVRAKWELDDLQPYIDALVQELEVSQAELLLQYTSSSMDEVTGVKVYGAKA